MSLSKVQLYAITLTGWG